MSTLGTLVHRREHRQHPFDAWNYALWSAGVDAVVTATPAGLDDDLTAASSLPTRDPTLGEHPFCPTRQTRPRGFAELLGGEVGPVRDSHGNGVSGLTR